MLGESHGKLSGEVEVDEIVIGGKAGNLSRALKQPRNYSLASRSTSLNLFVPLRGVEARDSGMWRFQQRRNERMEAGERLRAFNHFGVLLDGLHSGISRHIHGSMSIRLPITKTCGSTLPLAPMLPSGFL
jgi:hypothetical protein